MSYLMDAFDLPSEFNGEKGVTIGKYEYLYVCKNCGAELYSEYKYLDSYDGIVERIRALENELSRGRDSSARGANGDTSRNLSAKKKELSQLNKKYDQIRALSEKAKKKYLDSVNKTTATCPVCGATLTQEKGFFLPDGYCFYVERMRTRGSKGAIGNLSVKEVEELFCGASPTISRKTDENFQLLKTVREGLEREQVRVEVKAYAESCDLPAVCSRVVQTTELKSDTEALKGYVLNLTRLENNIYSLKQLLFDLYYRRFKNNRAVILGTHEPAYIIKSELKELKGAYQKALKAVKEAEEYQPEVSVKYPPKPTAPVLSKPGLFNKKKVLEENEALTAKYQADLEKYQKKVAHCKEEEKRQIAEMHTAAIAEAQKKADLAEAVLREAEADSKSAIKEAKNRPVPAMAAKELLDKEIAEAEVLLRNTFAARNELYAYDIIFGKYRDVVALSSFYEYLMAGRCTSLEGADGAYNIYENEIRMNRVINQLDTVITSLEEIKQNQYMMYQELRNINSSLESLNSTMDKALTSIQGIEANTTKMNEYMEHISQNSDVVAHNTAVAAYYSKVNAELTNALGYMAAF